MRTMAESETKKKKSRSWTTRRNILDFIAVVSLILWILNFIIPLLPVRARLTLFLDHAEFTRYSGENYFKLAVFVKVVNDSPRTATIRTWDLLLSFNISYEILDQANDHYGLMLKPSAQTTLLMNRTLIGKNNTFLSENALQTITVWFPMKMTWAY